MTNLNLVGWIVKEDHIVYTVYKDGEQYFLVGDGGLYKTNSIKTLGEFEPA